MFASCPFLRCSCRKNLSYAEEQRVWWRSCGPKICYNTVIVLSVVLWNCCKPVNNCRDWAFSTNELDVWLPALQLPMFAKCDALPKGDLLDMFVSGLRSCHSFGKCQASNPYQKLELPESRVRSAISALNHGCIMPIPSLQLQKKPVICREAEGLVAELWSPRFVTCNTVIVLSVVLCDCCKPTNNCQDWDFSNGKLDVCLPAFRLPMFAKRDTAKMCFLGHSCLRNPCLFWNLSVHSLPEAWGPWERQYAPPALHYACIMLAKDPWVRRLAAASLSAADVRKMWCTAERRCVGHVCLRFNCRDWAFSKSELDVWLPAFQLPMSAKRDALPKRGLCDMFVKGNPCLLWTSKDPIPTRSLRWLWWLHHACKRSSFGIQDVDYRILIVISVVLYSDSCKSMKNCRDSASSYF